MKLGTSLERDIGFEQALDEVLGFYSAQLQSHAATLVSLFIGVFAILSIRSGGIVGPTLLVLVGPVLATGIVYSGLRLLAYGQLSKSILYGNLGDFDTFRTTYQKQPNSNWNEIFSHTKVS